MTTGSKCDMKMRMRKSCSKESSSSCWIKTAGAWKLREYYAGKMAGHLATCEGTGTSTLFSYCLSHFVHYWLSQTYLYYLHTAAVPGVALRFWEEVAQVVPNARGNDDTRLL